MSYSSNYPKKQWTGKGNYGRSGYAKAPKPKREKAPLATEKQKQSMKIVDLTYDFSNRIVRLYEYLNEDAVFKEYVLSKQVLRSGTSIGANASEAQHAQSDADFLSKMSIALKEARETSYWLRLLKDNGYLVDSQLNSMLTDNDRIIKILSKIVATTYKKIHDKSGEKV